MHPDLEALKITPKDIEGLTGLEVNEIFIGSVWGGTYRPSVFRIPRQFFSFGLTQIFVAILVFIFTLPIGLWLIRDSTGAIAPATISRFLQTTLGITGLAIVSWNLYMRLKVKALTPLAHLLDEVDKYNEVIQAMDMLDRLQNVGNPSTHPLKREQALEALNFARTSLVCGLMTEKILRQNRRLLARRHELFDHIETNLAALKALELSNQANEYTDLLNAALQIGISVQREVQQIND